MDVSSHVLLHARSITTGPTPITVPSHDDHGLFPAHIIQNTDINVLSIFVGGFVLVYSLISLLVRERLYIGESAVAMGIGMALGGSALGLINTNAWDPTAVAEISFQASRFLIAVQVTFAGIELPGKYLWTQGRSISVLLTLIMLLKWLTTAGFMTLLLGLPFLDALVLASCIAPTDPVLAMAIVKGKYAERHVPEHLRDLLSCESGANDGLGFPFLFLALYLRVYADTGVAVARWSMSILLYQVVLGVALGAVIGFAASYALRTATRKELVDKPSLLAFGVSLAVFTMGMVGYLGSDDLLAAFVAGNTFTWDDWYRQEMKDEHIQSTIDQLLTLSFFIFFGATFPFAALAALPYAWWQLLLLCISILLFRRLPWVLALYRFIPAIKTRHEALFAGWFGPMGVSGLFYAYIIVREPDVPAQLVRDAVPIISLIVFSSVICHGLSIPFFKLTSAAAAPDGPIRTLSRTITESVRITAQRARSRSRSRSRSRQSVDKKRSSSNLEDDASVVTPAAKRMVVGGVVYTNAPTTSINGAEVILTRENTRASSDDGGAASTASTAAPTAAATLAEPDIAPEPARGRSRLAIAFADEAPRSQAPPVVARVPKDDQHVAIEMQQVDVDAQAQAQDKG
ncbi:Sodium/hydrogen exchanger family-domain-containing protein [Blastocladiella britannica]|nr:Sodium/hydrogen exchanger family-domain-containing protein [Blastocladiella britannica]